MDTSMLVRVRLRRVCILMPVLVMSAFRKAPPISITRIDLPSWTAMVARENTKEVDAVEDDRLSYISLSYWSPPAASLALNL
jgi:hypothetical protein